MVLIARHSMIIFLSIAIFLAPAPLAASGWAYGTPANEPATVPSSPTGNFLPNLSEVVKPAATVRSLQHLVVDLKVDLPPNHEINRAAPGRVAIRSPLVGDALIAESSLDESLVSLTVHWTEQLPQTDRSDIVVEAAVYFCEESKKAICKIRSLRIFQPLTVDPIRGAERLVIQAEVPEN